MGCPNRYKITFVFFCLLLTGILLNTRPDPAPVAKSTTLSESFISFGKWRVLNDIPLDKNIQDALQLDDFLYRHYTNGSDIVNLYIGYYYTGNKVGAAHDPLVCFPGQGWVLSNRESKSFNATSDENKLSIDYATMQAERNERKDILLYWFQAQDKTSPNTLSQKIMLLWKKLSSGREENAFIRISMDMQDKTNEQCISVLNGFVDDFYPTFYEYVQSIQTPGKIK